MQLRGPWGVLVACRLHFAEQATTRDGGQVWEGLTDNYIRADTTSTLDLQNRLLPVRLTREGDGAVTGELIGEAYRP